MKPITTLASLIAVAAVAGAAVAWLVPGSTVAVDAGDPKLVALGAEVYAEHCAACHGAELEGQPNWRERNAEGRLPAPPHDASGHTWHHADDVLFRITKYGLEGIAPPGYETDMPAYEGVLGDREINAVLSYIKSQWPPEIRARQERLSAAAR